MTAQDRFVVTTRSRLRGLHTLPTMLLATRRVMTELHRGGEDPEVAASVIASPHEFWTVSVWSSRHAMQEFLRSGAHGRHLWDVQHLLESFWLLRWRPTRHELGSWRGRTLAPPLRPPPEQVGLPRDVRAHVLAEMPHLLEAFGADGRPSYAHSPEVREQRDQVAGAAGVLLRLPTRGGPRGAGRALRGLATTLRAQDDDLLRVVVGRGQRGAGRFLLGVWADESGSGRLLDSGHVRSLVERWGEDCWACELLPENEFGHWDGLRLRELATRHRAEAPHGPGRP